MNLSSIYLETAVVGLALGLLLLDLWTPAALKPKLGYLGAVGLLVILGLSFTSTFAAENVAGFGGMYIRDSFAMFFKRFFLIAATLVLLMSVEFSGRFVSGISEFYVLVLFALSGMMFASSANDLVMVFVSLELITISFYVLVSFQRARMGSLEAGVKYLILGAMSTGFLLFGIALVFGTTDTTSFSELRDKAGQLAENKIFILGLLLIVAGLGFKLAAFPFQIWAPDVYQGSPAPATAFLAIGSKAAGVVLLMRFLFGAVPEISVHWAKLLMVVAAVTILYGNLCAIPQRNIKRLLGYSSIANAGYILLGVAALNVSGSAAILYYLAGYLVTLAAAFIVVCLVARESDDISAFAGLGQRSPLLAASLALSMVSLAGIPPLAGFFGKFLLFKSIVEQGSNNVGYYCLAGTAVFGVVVSLYYYMGVVRAVYWSKETTDLSPIAVSVPMRLSLGVCIAGMLYLGLRPAEALNAAQQAVDIFKL